MDANGNLLVNIKAGAGSGGTAQADKSTFTPGTTSMTPIGCGFFTSYTALINNQAGVVGCLPFTVGSNTGNAAATYVVNALPASQATSANSSPVVLASDQKVGDPCTYQLKTNVPISTATGTTALVTGVSAKKIYVCSLTLVTPTAVSISLSEGSSSTCGTSAQAGVIGVATSGTAANGMAFAANGGLTLGTGHATIASTATAANYLCLFQSGTAQIAGNLTYVQQ
jgi:hypothetical protein